MATLKGSSISLVSSDSLIVSPSSVSTKSWAELETFFARERQDVGKGYKKHVRKQIKEYRSWVFSSVDCIVDRFSSIDFSFYRTDTKQELLPSSPYYKAITKPILYPNAYMSFSFIKAWVQTQIDLCGKGAILKLRNKLGRVWELWPLDMNYFEGIEGDDTNPLVPPVGFKFKIRDEVYVFTIDDIIWLRYPHPESLWDGFSPIQAQAYATDIDYYLEVYERGFFKNSARVDFILEHEGNLDEEGAARLKDQWVKAYGGYDRSYQPVVASGGLKVVPITMSNRDFQFIETAKWTKDKILSAYRVPEGKLGLFEDINRANQKGIDIAFNEECYSEDTEFLTDQGWRNIFTYQNEKIATVNPTANEIEYHLPDKKIIYDHKGKMIQFSTRQIDMLVTPNHNMWYSRQTGISSKTKGWTTKFTPWDFEGAKKLGFSENSIGASRTYVMNPPVTYDSGNGTDKLIIAEVAREGNGAYSEYDTPSGEHHIDMALWCEFLGYYLSEGSASQHRYAIAITQSVDSSDKIAHCLEQLPFDFKNVLHANGNGDKDTIVKFYVDNKTLWEHLLDECGIGCEDKVIPSYVMESSARYKSILFEAMLFGDGTKNRFGNKRGNSSEYSSITLTSPKMIDQLGIIAIELGYKVSYGKPWDTGGGKKAYRINLTRMPYSSIRAHQITEVFYDGIVWCFNVPNHLFITRRNGKVAVQGNCIQPRLKMWDVEFTKQLIYEFTDLVEMKHDNPVPRDREMDLKELALRGNSVPINTPNELRVWWDGRKPVEGGDVILIDNKLIPLGMAGEIEDPEGGGDRPGAGSEDPEYDPEYDPGGEDTDKAVMATVNRAVRHIVVDYDRALAHTNGWSYERASTFAEGRIADSSLGSEVKKLYVESIKDGLSRDEFRRRLLRFLAGKVYRRVGIAEKSTARVPTDKE